VNRVSFLCGLAFGFLVVAARLDDYGVIHDMLLLREPDVFLLMASAIGVAAPILLVLRRRGWVTPYGGALKVTQAPVTRNAVAGASVFGAGWAIAGTCPIPALAMVAEGSVVGVFVVGGMFGGIALRDQVAMRRDRHAARAGGPSAVGPGPALAAE
jgi:uncharacterized membrane protein YedE/YeeE